MRIRRHNTYRCNLETREKHFREQVVDFQAIQVMPKPNKWLKFGLADVALSSKMEGPYRGKVVAS